MPKQSFSDVFDERLKEMEQAAHAKGLNLTIICKELGISRATPDRWKKEKPKTIELLERMESFVSTAKPKEPESVALPASAAGAQ